ncbi:MAG TPA: CPBP family intramembrane glutamic endopeptidase [Terriglobales bacterium]|jgi:membrane protease YdiL (CAAX protease family)|nr:CPBP family intramembrane glutamic endopeptidase [Terriglobales bacterium]
MDQNPNSGGADANVTAGSPPSGLAPIFLGPSGLRAGWRFAIYVAAVIGLMYAASHAVRPLFPKSRGETPSLWAFLIWECASFLVAVLPAFVLSRFENRPFDDYGLPRRGAFGLNFWSGAAWGLLAITCLLLLLRATGAFYFGGIALHGVRVLKFAGFWAVMFIVVGLFEEFLTRGYSQFTLAQGIGFWPAALLLSIGFGAIHLNNQGEAWIGAAGAAAIALFFCLTLRRTGNLWFAVGMHASWDWGETFLYSVPNSGMIAPGHLMSPSFHGSRWLTGGSVGPEGSVLVFLLIAVLWVLFDRLYPAKAAKQAPA